MHAQDFLYKGSKDGLLCTKHSSHELLSPTRTQYLKNLVIPPRLQLALCVLPPESSNCDLVGSCDEPGHRHFPFLGHFQLLLKKTPDLLQKRWGILLRLLRSIFQPWCQEWPPASFLCQPIHHRLQLLLCCSYVLSFIARSSRLTGGACDSQVHASKPRLAVR